MESLIISKAGTANIVAYYSVVEIGAFLCDFYEQESGWGEKWAGITLFFWVQQQHVWRGVV